jgi:hypothetical protein
MLISGPARGQSKRGEREEREVPTYDTIRIYHLDAAAASFVAGETTEGGKNVLDIMTQPWHRIFCGEKLLLSPPIRSSNWSSLSGTLNGLLRSSRGVSRVCAPPEKGRHVEFEKP